MPLTSVEQSSRQRFTERELGQENHPNAVACYSTSASFRLPNQKAAKKKTRQCGASDNDWRGSSLNRFGGHVCSASATSVMGSRAKPPPIGLPCWGFTEWQKASLKAKIKCRSG
jgi:hypothetical protein